MWNLTMPDITAARAQLDVLFPDTDTTPVLTAEEKDILENLYQEYEQAAGRPNPTWLEGGLTKSVRNAVLAAYGEISDRGKLSELRSSLKLSVNECPYCGFGEIKDLDHHLQKAHFECFSVFPLNLVPACSKCNGHKPRKPRFQPKKHHLHAYLEDVSEYRFLVADVALNAKAMSVQFRIEQAEGMSDELFARLQQHLIDFHLNDRYPAQVNIFLSEQKTGLAFAYEVGGSKAVRTFLERSAKANENSFGKNDWRVALLSALSRNKAFCRRGFFHALGYEP